MARYFVEFPDDSPFFTTKDEDGSPEPVFIVAFTRGDYTKGSELITDLQAASDNSPGFISGDFQLASVVVSEENIHHHPEGGRDVTRDRRCAIRANGHGPRCRRVAGHDDDHRTYSGETW